LERLIKLIVNGLLWFSAIGAGLIAGVFFAFSTSS
jgi:uncharacterized membrane protein